jgi:hypothetical protein
MPRSERSITIRGAVAQPGAGPLDQTLPLLNVRDRADSTHMAAIKCHLIRGPIVTRKSRTKVSLRKRKQRT